MHDSLILFKVKRSSGTKRLRKIKNLTPHCCDSDYTVYKQIYTLPAKTLAISNGNNREHVCMSMMELKKRLQSKQARCFVLFFTIIEKIPSSAPLPCRMIRNNAFDDTYNNSLHKRFNTLQYPFDDTLCFRFCCIQILPDRRTVSAITCQIKDSSSRAFNI